MKKTLFVLLILISVKHIRAQIYADSETNGTNGLCVGCYVNNPSHAVDGNTSTHSDLILTVGTSGAKINQNLRFSVPGIAGEFVGMIVEEPSLQVLTPALLSGVTLTTFSNNVSNNDTKSSVQYSISLEPGQTTRYIIQFHPASNFDAVQLDLNAGVLGSLTGIRIYYGFHTMTLLPVEFLDFKAEVDETNILLKWNMQKEESDGHYAVERSPDALNYQTLGTINSKGNLHNVTSYELNDVSPLRGQSYYRLRRYDKYGVFKTLSLITTQFTPVDFNIFPNPAKDLVNFQYSVSETEYAVIEIYTTDGMKLKSYSLDPMFNNLSVKEQLKQGIYQYFYKINGETKEKGKLLIWE